MPSEYDALLETQPAQPKSEYDALLTSPQQEQPSAHPILSGIGAGIWRAIPKSLGEVAGFVGADIVPSAVHSVLQAGREIRDVVGGASPEQAVRREDPATMQQGEVLRGEHGTREQAAGWTGVGIQAAMLALPFIKPLRLKLRDIAFGKPEGLAAETAAETEVMKNATQERQVQESVLTERARDDARRTPAAAGSSGGVRSTAEVPQEKPVAPVPQPEQPRIISTAVQSGDTIVRGEGFEPHDSIAARVAAERPSPTQETGVSTEVESNIRGILGVMPDAPIHQLDSGNYMVERGNDFAFFDPQGNKISLVKVSQTDFAEMERIANAKESPIGQPKTEVELPTGKFTKSTGQWRRRLANGNAGALVKNKELISQLEEASRTAPVPKDETRPSGVAAALKEEQKGFLIREPDGTERFTNDRGEAARIATAAGQVKPENAGTTELHSQQLAEPVSTEGEVPTVATQPKEVPPPETPEALGEALSEKPRLAGPSNRVLQERAARGEIPQAPESGHGILKEDLIAQANQRYSPERAQLAGQKALQGKTTLADEADVVLHEEKLTKAAADAERALKSNPTDPALQEAYQTARNAMTDWQHGPISAIKTAWNRKGINLQGATDVDTGTLVGLQKLAWDSGKGDFTPQQRPIMDEAANRVTRSIAEEKTSILKANTEVQKVLKPSRYMDLNQLRESLEQTLKSITC